MSQKLLFAAVKAGDVAAMREILTVHPELLNEPEPKEQSAPLHLAAWRGQLEAARLLLSLGADVQPQNTNTHWGTTPLHAAAHSNNAAIIELLLQHGADINPLDLDGKTPLQHTAIHKATAATKVLRAHGAVE